MLLQISQSKLIQFKDLYMYTKGTDCLPHDKCQKQIHMHSDSATFEGGMEQCEDEERGYEASEGGQITRDPEETHGLME